MLVQKLSLYRHMYCFFFKFKLSSIWFNQYIKERLNVEPFQIRNYIRNTHQSFNYKL